MTGRRERAQLDPLGTPVTAPVSSERAAYEAASDLWANGVIGSPSIPWEEMSPDERGGWVRVRQAALQASPEVAEALATIEDLRALVGQILGSFAPASMAGAPALGDAVACVSISQVTRWRERSAPRKGTPVDRAS